MLSDYHILSLEKCNGQKASSKRKKYFNDSSQNPWKMESLYYVREKKKKGIISLSLDKDYTFENLSEHFQFTFKFSCFEELLLCNGILLLVIKILSVIFHFQVCFAWLHPIAHSYRTFSYLHSHLKLVKHFYHFYINFYIIFLEFMLLFFWLKKLSS